MSKLSPELEAFVEEKEKQLWGAFFALARENGAGEELDECLVTILLEGYLALTKKLGVSSGITDRTQRLFEHYRDHHSDVWKLWQKNPLARKPYTQALILKAFEEYANDEKTLPPSSAEDRKFVAVDNRLWDYVETHMSQNLRNLFADEPVYNEFRKQFLGRPELSIHAYLPASKAVHDYLGIMYPDFITELGGFVSKEWADILEEFILTSVKLLGKTLKEGSAQANLFKEMHL